MLIIWYRILFVKNGLENIHEILLKKLWNNFRENVLQIYGADANISITTNQWEVFLFMAYRHYFIFMHFYFMPDEFFCVGGMNYARDYKRIWTSNY